MALSRRERWIYIRDVLVCTLNVFFAALYPKLRPSRKIDLSGRIAIITGANSGIGLQLAIDLARQHCDVYLACRNVTKGEEAAKQVRLQSNTSGTVHVLQLDTSSRSSVRLFVKEWGNAGRGAIDYMFHNAGIPHSHGQVTDEGLDLIYATNFLGSFLLTALLEPRLSAEARVVFTAAAGQYAGKLEKLFHEANDDKSRTENEPENKPMEASPSVDEKSGAENNPHESFQYVDTKLMQCTFAYMLQQRWRETNHPRRFAHAFTPGYAQTAIFDKTVVSSFRANPLLYMIKHWTALAVSAEQGAATGFWLATTDDGRVVGPKAGGGFWDRMIERVNKAKYIAPETRQKAWEIWERDAEVVWT